MPELPDVESFRKYFAGTCTGKTVKNVEVRRPRILDAIQPEQLVKALTGKSFVGTMRIGKNLLVRTDGSVWLTLHFGMSGYLRYCREAGEEPPNARVLFEFTDGTKLAYDNQRMIGKVGITESPEAFVRDKALGTDALAISREEFTGKLRGSKGKIKQVLMDQSLVAGIGNEYADEILFQAKLHPELKVEKLEPRRFDALYDLIRDVLEAAVEANADVDQMPTGFMLHERKKKGRCPACASEFVQTKVGGRTTYLCPRCQSAEATELGTLERPAAVTESRR